MIWTRILEYRNRLPVVMVGALGSITAAGYALMVFTAFAAPQTESESLDLSEEKLRVVAEAYLEVFEIQQTYRHKIQTAQTTEEAQMLQQEANRESQRVVEELDNLTVQEYSDTLSAASEDDDLWRDLVAIVEAIQEEGAQEENEQGAPRR